jgi:hypothetical protein
MVCLGRLVRFSRSGFHARFSRSVFTLRFHAKLSRLQRNPNTLRAATLETIRHSRFLRGIERAYAVLRRRPQRACTRDLDFQDAGGT